MRREVSWTSMDIRYPYIPIGGGKGYGESAVVLVNREERQSERKRSHTDGIDSN